MNCVEHLVIRWIVCKRNLERENRADVKPTEAGGRDNLLRKHGCEVKSVTGMGAPTFRSGRGRSEQFRTIIEPLKARAEI